jgi:hypothetical protein
MSARSTGENRRRSDCHSVQLQSDANQLIGRQGPRGA